jgi:hypothetical protein
MRQPTIHQMREESFIEEKSRKSKCFNTMMHIIQVKFVDNITIVPTNCTYVLMRLE